MTDDEMYSALEFINVDTVFEHVCERCSVSNDDCYRGSKDCPFSSEFSELLSALYQADCVLKSLAREAEEYQETIEEKRRYAYEDLRHYMNE